MDHVADRADGVELRNKVMQGVEEVEREECLEFDEKGLKAFFRDLKVRGRERFQGDRKQG